MILVPDFKSSVGVAVNSVVIWVSLTNNKEVFFAAGDPHVLFMKNANLEPVIPGLCAFRVFLAEIDANCASISLHRLRPEGLLSSRLVAVTEQLHPTGPLYRGGTEGIACKSPCCTSEKVSEALIRNRLDESQFGTADLASWAHYRHSGRYSLLGLGKVGATLPGG